MLLRANPVHDIQRRLPDIWSALKDGEVKIISETIKTAGYPWCATADAVYLQTSCTLQTACLNAVR
jgi:hypothetical protein